MSDMSVNDRFVNLVGVIEERQGLMKSEGVASFDALSSVSELITFVVSTDDLIEVDNMNLVRFVALHGKAAGVALVVDSHRPDATVLREEFKAKMNVRLVAGRIDSTSS